VNISQLPQTIAPIVNYVWALLLAASLPLIALAAWKHIFPHKRLVVALLVPMVVSLGLVWRPEVLVVMALLDAGIVLVALLDTVSLPRKSWFSVERSVVQIASLGFPQEVALTINNQSNTEQRLQIRDDRPQEFTSQPEQFHISLGPRSRAALNYQFSSRRRGAFRLETVYVKTTSRFGLWQRLLKYPLTSDIHVYPDMKQLSEYALLARTNRLSLMGVRRARKVGQDHDFERLRDYTRDDNHKHIEWRASARRRKLTVREYQTSQSQRVIFLLDCGRMMTNESAGLSLLDHALNALLMLSFVALRQGDQVGLICFSDQIHSYVPSRSGMRQMNHLLHASFDRFPKLVESRYDQAFLYLATHCRKRSLVVLITNVIDEVNALQVRQYLGTLVGRHLPLGVLLRDHRMFDAADIVHPSGNALFRAAAASQILVWRRQVLNDLLHQGCKILDTFPEDMTAPLVNQYLEIKARHLL